ncbi:cullin-associated and neddylation dissociated [Actinidia rufa]|uniref:Cullin-associated and neddylation dissociated n=1 Tax=Actinidia rufa TaxID=165716 RepID=A0A7J0DSG2_9ERIC|nr:cullin-associated and neddylation dissociated [Actinidia rufa]
MASGSSGHNNPSSKGFNFATDDILCLYEDYAIDEASNGSHSDSGIVPDSAKVQVSCLSSRTQETCIPHSHKCLHRGNHAPLAKKVNKQQVVEMTNKLCDKLLNGKEQHRDVASIALKIIISEIPTSSIAQSILLSISPQLIKGITDPPNVKCCYLREEGDAVPILLNYCTSASENEEELREYSFQALESFLLRCPRDIYIYCDEILNHTLEYLSYDPNFTIHDNMDEDNGDESRDGSANEYTDDEDISWKVRRAGAKGLAALIVSRPEMLSKLYEEVLNSDKLGMDYIGKI